MIADITDFILFVGMDSFSTFHSLSYLYEISLKQLPQYLCLILKKNIAEY